MKLDLREVLAGAVTELPFAFSLPTDDLDAGSGPLWGVRFPGDLSVSGVVRNTAGYIRLTLEMQTDYVAPCARCLEDVPGTFWFSLEKTLATADEVAGMPDDVADDYLETVDGFLSIDDLLLDLVYMEFPAKILCRPDCLGLCPTCGKNLNDGPCDCVPEPDPRLAPLAEILAELTEKEKRENDK